VSAEEADELHDAVWQVAGAEPLLRDQLVEEVVRSVGKKHAGRLRSGFAFFTGELCQGPPHGNKITLVRPDKWIGKWKRVKREDAIREVLRRFLWAYGPARPVDFRAWFQAEVPFDIVDVEEVDVEGHRAFVLAGDTDFPEAQKDVRLLPEYDVYVMGFREREHLVPERVREQVAGHGRGRYEGPAGVRFLLVDGVAAGLWERKKLAKRLEVRVSPARRVRRGVLQDEVARFAEFLGVEPVLTVE
jgi:Winged helix DNA-binding domain